MSPIDKYVLWKRCAISIDSNVVIPRVRAHTHRQIDTRESTAQSVVLSVVEDKRIGISSPLRASVFNGIFVSPNTFYWE